MVVSHEINWYRYRWWRPLPVGLHRPQVVGGSQTLPMDKCFPLLQDVSEIWCGGGHDDSSALFVWKIGDYYYRLVQQLWFVACGVLQKAKGEGDWIVVGAAKIPTKECGVWWDESRPPSARCVCDRWVAKLKSNHIMEGERLTSSFFATQLWTRHLTPQVRLSEIPREGSSLRS